MGEKDNNYFNGASIIIDLSQKFNNKEELREAIADRLASEHRNTMLRIYLKKEFKNVEDITSLCKVTIS